jgi:hypothetical protein
MVQYVSFVNLILGNHIYVYVVDSFQYIFFILLDTYWIWWISGSARDREVVCASPAPTIAALNLRR